MAESVVMYSYNGTEYYFIIAHCARIEELLCLICLELVYEPVLNHCGHLFCLRCVRSATSCPVCRVMAHFMRDQFTELRVKHLKVKCPNWEKGCTWQGDLGDTARHTDTNCRMEDSHCPTDHPPTRKTALSSEEVEEGVRGE